MRRIAFWLSGSFALHAGLLVALHDSVPAKSDARHLDQLWLETLPAPSEQEPPAPEPAQPAKPAAPRPRAHPAVTAAPPSAAPGPETTEHAGSQPIAAGSEQDGTLELAADSGVPPRLEPERPALPAQLSLWLAPIELQHMVIVRSPRALLAALPGYRDMLRSADIDPFLQLRALRVYLPGLHGEQLALAGVHAEGEQAVVDSAERVAASRERVPNWRRSSELRAAAWLDGSGYDRGLALHGSAFVIAARRALPGLLGETAPWQRVDHLAKLRSGVVVAATLNDASSYLPSLRACQLRSLHFSISAAQRLHLQADYESADKASQASSCLSQQLEAPSQLRALVELLSRATAATGSTQSELRTGVTNEEIARLLDELSWSLRRVVRG